MTDAHEFLIAGGTYRNLYMRSTIPLRPLRGAATEDLEVLAGV
jgi:hypothetical protein